LWSYQLPASAQPDNAWGMMGGDAPDGHMNGWTGGHGPCGDVQGDQTNQTLDRTPDKVKSRMERWVSTVRAGAKS
jgi:hypothetical protein